MRRCSEVRHLRVDFLEGPDLGPELRMMNIRSMH